MQQDPDRIPPDAPETASDLRRRTRGANRTVAALLIGVAVVFLGGAFAVALLVVHAPV